MPLSQVQLNYLARDIEQSKKICRATWLDENNLLALGTTYFWYCKIDEKLSKFFSLHDNSSLVYCSDIGGLVEAFGLIYSPVE